MALLAWYKLDGNLLDSSGNTNHLIYHNNSNSILENSSGKIGGSYERIALNNGTDWFGSTNKVHLNNDFTMCCWAFVKACHMSTANGLVTNHNHALNSGAGITVKTISDTDFRISCNTGSGGGRTYHSYYGTSNIKDRWAHLIVRYERQTNNLTLWVDGVKEYEITYDMYVVEDDIGLFSWSLGHNGSTSYRPQAILDDVRIYDHALSTKEIKELAKAKVGHWTLDSHAQDISGYECHGEEYNILYSNDNQIGTSCYQNDLREARHITISNSPHVTLDQTIAMWLYPTSDAVRRNPWNKAYGGEGTITHETSGSLTYYWGTHGGNGSPYQGVGSNSIPLNTWSHVAVVRDLSGTGTIKWYINGIKTNETTATYTESAKTTASIYIGDGYTGHYEGRIDDVRQYATALSDEDIKELYQTRASLDDHGNFYINSLSSFPRSAMDILKSDPTAESGFYWIQPTKDEAPFQAYCDMDTAGGGWTLLICSQSQGGTFWNETTLLEANKDNPSINSDYSILRHADDIKTDFNGKLQYRMDAEGFGRWGGIWEAPYTNTFMKYDMDQPLATNIEQWDVWTINTSGGSSNSLTNRMPWIKLNSNTLLSTWNNTGNWWGTLVTNHSSFNPAPWLSSEKPNPGIIWYWVR